MKRLIKKIIDDREIYGRFLNTLSLLEYVGARKILKSQSQEKINEKVLAHVSEEIRHAQVLKKLALKYAPNFCENYTQNSLFCGEAALRYFQTVDRSVEKVLANDDTWHAYLFTTYLIELRATEFYEAFEEVLQENGQTAFRGILVEEERHLQEVSDWILSIPAYREKLHELKEIEAQLFLKFMQAMQLALNAEIDSRTILIAM